MLVVVTEGSAFRSRADPLQSRPGAPRLGPCPPRLPSGPLGGAHCDLIAGPARTEPFGARRWQISDLSEGTNERCGWLSPERTEPGPSHRRDWTGPDAAPAESRAGPVGQQVAPAPAGPRPWPPPLPSLVSPGAQLRRLSRPRAGVQRPQAPGRRGLTLLDRRSPGVPRPA